MALTRLLTLPIFHLLVVVILYLGYYTPRPVRLLYVGALSFTYLSIIHYVPREQAGLDYTFGMSMAFQLLVIETNIYEDFYRLDEKQKADHTPKKYKDLSFWGKWKCSTTTLEYLRASIVHLCWYYVLQDLGRAYLSTNPFVQSDRRDGISISDMKGFGRFETVLALGLGSFVNVDIPYTFFCVVGMSSRCFWTKPQNNHPVVGRWRDGWTLRRLSARYDLYSHTQSANATGFSCNANNHVSHGSQLVNGSMVSRYVQVYLSFFLSAFLHVAAGHAADPDRRSWSGTWMFFLAQAHGILAEDFAQWAGKRMGIRESNLTHLLGGIWVACWLTWTAPWFADDIIEIGLVRPEPFPLSVIRGLWNGQWKTSRIKRYLTKVGERPVILSNCRGASSSNRRNAYVLRR
ncbi:membrane bound o-acyl transferase family protein [Hirsutella rhossiliensis]